MRIEQELKEMEQTQPESREAVPTPGIARADAARQVRVDAADFQRGIPLPAHPDNGDEARYPSRFASYTKGLPHDSLGEVNTTEYSKLLTAVNSGNASDFEAITLGGGPGSRQLVNPQAAYAYQLEGADSHALALAPAPTFASPEAAGEMEELYAMSLVRDIPFQDYTTASPPALITEVILRLNQLSDFRGPRQNGQVTVATLFRDNLPGSTVGPFLSQFLLQDVPYGSQLLPQRQRTRVAGDDQVFTFAEWLNIQNGIRPSRPEAFDSTRRYIRNGRDLAEFVHHDFPLQTSLNAALIILVQNDTDLDGKSSPPTHDPNNPYRFYTKQDSFATFGNADAQDLICRVMKLALLGVWFQKWQVHRRLRPETFGGRVHNTKTGARSYPVYSELLSSPLLQRVFDRNKALNGGSGGTYLLNQAFPEGSPVHPAYGSGHSTYIGAGVTMLKAFLKEDLTVKNPVVPSADGLSLVPYTGPALTVLDELDKLASNVGMGRLFAGVHYRSDHEHAVRLGELIALRALQDLTRTYHESFSGFQVRTFGGNTLTITATGPSLPNHVSSIQGFTLVNAQTGTAVPGYESLLDRAMLYREELPPSVDIRASTFPSAVGSVRFTYDGGTSHTNTAPYGLAQALGTPLTPGLGSHVLTATPFSGSGGSGLGGVPASVRFRVATRRLLDLPLDEGSGFPIDRSPGHNTLTCKTVTWTNDGYSGSALDFGPNSTPNGICALGPIQGALQQEFSIEAWVKLLSNPPGVWGAIMSQEDYLNNGFRLGVIGDGRLSFWTSQSGGNIELQASKLLRLNVYEHIRVEFSSGQARLYLNGELVGTKSGTYVPSSRALAIGYIGGVAPFTGYLDSILITVP
ncbi:LamG-like jellyroll fold domain-containing protein [Archangium sp.]|uniref:LamG-like jellyroll fold domain-containing protein n=1 Tax=Archangium sp. TaxID=1872627 RepID=UPI002D56006A|nr:LamG-like jellyroll fold domain-containing protein [Archangium sp.]HYO56388.1 LamG-like jellyroll fold domain-containing protein [Archangium sp.]